MVGKKCRWNLPNLPVNGSRHGKLNPFSTINVSKSQHYSGGGRLAAKLFFQLLPSQIQANGDDCAFLCTAETRAAHHVNGVTAEVTTGTQHL